MIEFLKRRKRSAPAQGIAAPAGDTTAEPKKGVVTKGRVAVATGAVLAASAVAGYGCLPGNPANPDTVPAAVQGTNEATWRQSTQTPYRGDGAFRTSCLVSHYNYSDPIIFPGKEGAAKSHLHRWYGPVGGNYDLTPGNIRGPDARSVCEGGTTNLTGYWTPAIVDVSNDMLIHGGPVGFDDPLQIYYKNGYIGAVPSEVEWFPEGLRMIAGGNTSARSQPAGQRIAGWNCLGAGYPGAQNYVASPGGEVWFNGIPQHCKPGQYLQMVIEFPQCWDGKNLDSSDHRSHMAYALGWPDKGCPASHPVTLPQITEHARWWLPIPGTPVEPTAEECVTADRNGDGDTNDEGERGWPRFNPYDPGWPNFRPSTNPEGCDLWPEYEIGNLRLSSDPDNQFQGTTAHADWFNGWDPAVGDRIARYCLQLSMDCGLGVVPNGDGTTRTLGPARRN